MQRVVLQQSHQTLCRLLQVEAREINAIWHEASLWATAWQHAWTLNAGSWSSGCGTL